jgi:Leucine-rich repeat (LRR) protein
LPKDLGEFTYLEEFALFADPDHDTAIPLRSIPENIGNLKHLRTLCVQNTSLVTLPESIGRLQNLIELELQGNGLFSLPENIGELQNLRILELSYNNLTSLPESIGNLHNLEELHLGGCPLESLPESIGNLQWLNILDLSDTSPLDHLPAPITKLNYLYEIHIGFDIELTPEQEKWVNSIEK